MLPSAQQDEEMQRSLSSESSTILPLDGQISAITEMKSSDNEQSLSMPLKYNQKILYSDITWPKFPFSFQGPNSMGQQSQTSSNYPRFDCLKRRVQGGLKGGGNLNLLSTSDSESTPSASRQTIDEISTKMNELLTAMKKDTDEKTKVMMVDELEKQMERIKLCMDEKNEILVSEIAELKKTIDKKDEETEENIKKK